MGSGKLKVYPERLGIRGGSPLAHGSGTERLPPVGAACLSGFMSKILAAEVWPVVHAERRALLEDLRGLGPEAWQVPSWCPGWDVHDVVAHLIDSAKTTRLGFLRRMLAVGFDFDRDNARGVARERHEDPQRTLAALAAVLEATKTPPANPATRLVEAFVHGEDVRGPLGLTRSYPAQQLEQALKYQLNTSVKLGGGRESAAGFTIVAAETGLVHGAGPEVVGTALGLLLAVSGRPVDVDAFSGGGAAIFLNQLGRR